MEIVFKKARNIREFVELKYRSALNEAAPSLNFDIYHVIMAYTGLAQFNDLLF